MIGVFPSWLASTPSTILRNHKNCYRLGNNDYINNFTVLILQLLQSTVKLPFHNKKGSHGADDSSVMGDDSFSEDAQADDRLVVESYKDAESLAKYFFYHFLTRCTAKSEDDFRRLFEQFLQEILLALYRPEWPVAELVLSVLGSLLVMFFRNQNVRNNQEASKGQGSKAGADNSFVVLPSLRVASLDYLGTIAARLRRDRVSALGSTGGENSENNRLDLVVRGIIYDEMNDMSKTLDQIDINHLSSTEKLRKLEQALIDYIIGTKGESDVSVEYVVTFYAAEWYRMTVLDVNAMKQKYQEDLKQQMTQKEAAKIEKKLERIMEKGANMKEFIRNLMDKKHLKKRTQYIAKTGNVMIDSDAYWVVKYLASKKELSQSFDYYLNNILEGFNPIFPVAIRTKAMKCLSQLVEADHQVLVIPDVNKIVQDRLIDPNAAVREATFELIGKYLVSRPDLVDTYYSILINRIKDSAIAVRKRVIRILRDVIEKQPKLDKKPEILARIINRINDEDGVKKLCTETLQNLWFLPLRDIEKKELEEKISSMADTATVCLKENMIEQYEQVVCAILTNCQEKVTIYAAKQLIDALVDCVISLNLQIARDDGSAEEVGQAQLIAKRRLNASLATLSVFAKARPELLVGHADVFVPYVLWSKEAPDSTPTELRVLNQMIGMLERIVPLMEHPSENFLANLDSRLNVVVGNISSMVIISSSISCMSAIYEKFKRIKPGICELFLKYLNILTCYYESNLHFGINNLNTALSSPQLFGSAAVDHSEEEKAPPVFRDKVFSILLFFSRSKEDGIRSKALIALGQYSSGCPELLNKPELKNMYTCLLKSDHKDFLMLKVQVLKNLSYFLSAEEDRAVKKNVQFRKEREENKETDLKEMELSSSGLSSSVIQDYWLAILNCYINKEDMVRTEAAQVIWQTLEQGLVTPGSSIPTLMAMSTDPLPVVRIKIENLIKDIDTKYSGMVAAKTTPGVQIGIRLAAESVLGVNDKTRLPKMSNDAQSLLSGLYVGIRTNRQQRRSFLTAMLRFFEENAKLEVEDWIFVADNLAHFPYQLMDEPLYVIHTANSIIDIAGQNILSNFKQLLAARKRYGRPKGTDVCPTSTPSSSGDNLDETGDDDDLTAEAIYTRFPNDKTPIYELKKNSQACFILLHLKFFLIKMYGFKEDKIKEYSPMHPAKAYDKPMTRKNIPSFSPDSIIRELAPEAIAAQDTIEGHMKLAEHFYNFNKMLLSLNKQDEEDDEDGDLTTTVADPADPGEDESNDGMNSSPTKSVRGARNYRGNSEMDSDGSVV
uniref:Nipped-B protein n=1 Tax=Ditylenchus dipsaci TaxID=166011 RepID=A0A915D8C6_9BILA